jgi:hypothetical protein
VPVDLRVDDYPIHVEQHRAGVACHSMPASRRASR